MKTITVFGSSFPKPGEQEYEDAYMLGKILGLNGFNVCSGGYQGMMDAVSKGAAEAGSDAIGVTVELFNSTPSQYLTEIVECDSLFERIKTLVTLADGFIILNGGTGTLLELSVIWEYFNKELIETKPIATNGTMWCEIVEIMERRLKLENRKTGLIECFENIDECADYLITTLKD